MFYLKKILTALTMPPFFLVILAFIGLYLTRRHPRSGRALASLALLALITLSLPPVSEALMRGLETWPPIPEQQLSRAQAIVILGADVNYDAPEYGGDTVGKQSLERLRYGVRLQKKTGLPILATGGAPFGGNPEADLMKKTVEQDFGGQVRWVETASRDTADNAAFSASILLSVGYTRIVLVSHAWHLRRATELFEQYGLEVLPAPTGFTTSSGSLFTEILPTAKALATSSAALHEWMGILFDKLTKSLWTK